MFLQTFHFKDLAVCNISRSVIRAHPYFSHLKGTNCIQVIIVVIVILNVKTVLS